MKNILLVFLALCSPLLAQVQLGNHVEVGGAGGGGGAQLQIFIPDPLGMQHVVVYPTTVSAVCGGSSCFPAFSSAVGSNVYAGGTVAPHNVIAGATINVAFGGYTLPSYVLAANVTSVYGYNVSEQFGEITSDVDCTWTGSGTTFVSNGNGTYTVPFSGLTGAHIPSVSCTGAWISSVFTAPFISSGVTVGPMALIVYYTGTAPPASNAINVEFPLHFTQNTLSINPTAPFPGLYAIPYTVAQLPTSATFPVPPALGAYLVSDQASGRQLRERGRRQSWLLLLERVQLCRHRRGRRRHNHQSSDAQQQRSRGIQRGHLQRFGTHHCKLQHVWGSRLGSGHQCLYGDSQRLQRHRSVQVACDRGLRSRG